GLKDYYTHELKADNPIAINFTRNTSTPTINIVSNQGVEVRGNIKTVAATQVTIDVKHGDLTGSTSGDSTSALYASGANVTVEHGNLTLAVVGPVTTPSGLKSTSLTTPPTPLNLTVDGDINVQIVAPLQGASSLVS